MKIISFVFQTVIKLLNKRDMKILFVISNCRGLRTPQTKFEVPVAQDNAKLHYFQRFICV